MAVETKIRVGKKKKETVGFAAENIDNTAPVNKILDELQFKNLQAYTFYCYNVRQRKRTNFTSTSHHVVPGHPLCRFPEDWDGDLNTEFFESFPYKSVVRMITPIANICKTDPLINCMKTKADWKSHLRSLRKSAIFRRQMSKYQVLNEDVWHCPKTFVDFAAALDSDPDPYFDSSYNWYYAGNGNMELLCIGWVDYLLHSKFNIVYLTEFSKDELIIKPVHSATYECEENENILETISSQNIVAVRTKHKIIILKIITEEENISLEKLKAIESKLPYTSINFDKFHNNILYVTTLDNLLIIVNIDRMKARTLQLKCKIESLEDNWSTVAGSERTYFTHVNSNSITIYDKRIQNPVHLWKDIKNVVDEGSCNDITSTRQEQGSTSLYFGTNHHLFLMDVRFYSHSKPKVVQRWTHGMQCPPTYISQCNFEFNRELLCLSSQWSEDMCLVSNYNMESVKGMLPGVMMPYRPKSLLGVLNEARESLLCFDINNPIDGRLCTSITGNIITEVGDKYYVLMQNALGDISCHTIYPEHLEVFVEDDSIQQLVEWSKSYKLEEKPFEVSSVLDISKVWNKLKAVPDNYQLVLKEDEVRDECKFSEHEVMDTFENDIDEGLKEVWFKDQDTTKAEQSSISFRLMFEDSE